MKINWTFRARKTFHQQLDHLDENWGQKEIAKFIEQTENTIQKIEENPLRYPPSKKHKNIRKGFVSRIISLFYRVKPRKKEVELLEFWDNRRNPKKLKY